MLIGSMFCVDGNSIVQNVTQCDDWDIYSFHINSTVTSRYATTVITSRVANRMDESKEIEFHVRIPKNAFINKFRMYNKMENQSIKINSVGRTLEEFKTSVTVAAHKKVTFELTYEELLKRRLGKYELQIHARPMQPVTDFKMDILCITSLPPNPLASPKMLSLLLTKVAQCTDEKCSR
uniref:VIT domain-containing protein n=1 Tax=Neogobius melanostomus TaxID=47308 RepID=A0A8C6UEB7_9GOBI